MRIECPFCGIRDETEFAYGGEAHIQRPALQATDRQWTDYLFFRGNVRGLQAERWKHVRGCGQWFNAVRDTVTHRFGVSYRATDPQPEKSQEPVR